MSAASLKNLDGQKRLASSRVNPGDSDKTLDDVAPVETTLGGTAVGPVGQGSEGPSANDEEDEGDDEGDKVGQDTKGDLGAHHLESDGEDH